MTLPKVNFCYVEKIKTKEMKSKNYRVIDKNIEFKDPSKIKMSK